MTNSGAEGESSSALFTACLSWLLRLAALPAASGQEERLWPVLAELARKKGFSIQRDRIGNILCERPATVSRLRILLAVHGDQVALWAKETGQDGGVRFRAPGVDPRFLPGLVVRHGERFGVVSFRPPHLLNAQQGETSAPKDTDLVVDFGSPPPQVRPGEPMFFASWPRRLGRWRLAAAGLDNRASLAAVLAAWETLPTLAEDVSWTIAVTAAEEVGRYGAKFLSLRAHFDLALVLDVTFGRSGREPEDLSLPLGRGPAIGLGPNSDPRLGAWLAEQARTVGCPVQWEILPEDSGTDGWYLEQQPEGARVVTCSIPLRYMHSAQEVVDVRDVEVTALLLLALFQLPAEAFPRAW